MVSQQESGRRWLLFKQTAGRELYLVRALAIRTFQTNRRWYRPLMVLALISCTPYVWHVPVGEAVERLASRFGRAPNAVLPLAVLIAYVVTVAVKGWARLYQSSMMPFLPLDVILVPPRNAKTGSAL